MVPALPENLHRTISGPCEMLIAFWREVTPGGAGDQSWAPTVKLALQLFESVISTALGNADFGGRTDEACLFPGQEGEEKGLLLTSLGPQQGYLQQRLLSPESSSPLPPPVLSFLVQALITAHLPRGWDPCRQTDYC